MKAHHHLSTRTIFFQHIRLLSLLFLFIFFGTLHLAQTQAQTLWPANPLVKEYPGTYYVPIDGPAAINPTPNVLVLKENAERPQIHYYLPEDLVGPQSPAIVMDLVKTQVSSDQKDQLHFRHRSGGFSLCTAIEEGLSCDSRYKNFNIGRLKVEETPAEKYAVNEELLSEKLRVARSFSVDPIGVLTVHCDQYACGLTDKD